MQLDWCCISWSLFGYGRNESSAASWPIMLNIAIMNPHIIVCVLLVHITGYWFLHYCSSVLWVKCSVQKLSTSTQVLYLTFEVLVLDINVGIYAANPISTITSQKEILYFLLHCVCLTVLLPRCQCKPCISHCLLYLVCLCLYLGGWWFMWRTLCYVLFVWKCYINKV